MQILRRLLGIFVMIAGIIGLLLSLTGLVGVVIAKPIITNTMNTTIDTLVSSVDTSQKTLEITFDALGATIDSIDSLSAMLDSTAITVRDTQPVITHVNDLMSKKLPETIGTATDSLDAAEKAAQSLESAIKSFEALQMVLGTSPLLRTIVPPASEPYNPEKSLADSLSDLSASIQDLPDTFIEMSSDLEKAEGNLNSVTDSMKLMSLNVSLISSSLSQYQIMIKESQSSTENLYAMLSNFRDDLPRITNITTTVLILFFLWLLAAQVVIFSQGFELFHGTAISMASNKNGMIEKESEKLDSEVDRKETEDE